MMAFEARSELVIDAPVARVWQALVDVARYPEWNGSLVRIDVEGDVPLAPGVPITVHAKPLAPLLPHVFPCVVDVLDPERELAWRGPTTPARHAVRARHGFRLEPVDETRTRFIHTEAFEGALISSLVWKRLGPLVAMGHAVMNECLVKRVKSLP